jgi:phosphatidate cytidylyltransferase
MGGPEAGRLTLAIYVIFFALAVPLTLKARRSGHEDFWPRLIIWLVIVPAFLLPAWTGGLVFSSLLFCCSAAAILEVARLNQSWASVIGRVSLLALSLPWLVYAQISANFSWPFVAAAGAVSILGCLLPPRSWGLVQPAFLSVFIGVSLSAWILLRKSDGGYSLTAFCFTVIILNDIFSSWIGRMTGGPGPFPGISPGKTWSGYLGGAATAVTAGLLFRSILPHFGLVKLGLAGLVLAVSGSAGDLFASWVKRVFKVKDFSQALGPMGGVLDRLDSLLGGGVVFYVLYRLAGY